MPLKWSGPIPFPTPIAHFPPISPAESRAGVYRVVASRPLSRIQGESPIVYVGSAAHLSQRLSKKHDVLPRLRELAAKLSPEVMFLLEIHSSAPQDVPDGMAPASWVRLLETAELNSYETTHLELPPLNRRSEGFIAGRAMLAVAEILVTQKLGIAKALAPMDEAENALTFLPLVLREGQKCDTQLPQLLWTWPEEWWVEAVPWWQHTRSFGRDNPCLTPDTLYAFIPVGNPLEARLPGDADTYDFAHEGGKWMALALTDMGWGSKRSTTSDAEALRSAISEPVKRLGGRGFAREGSPS